MKINITVLIINAFTLASLLSVAQQQDQPGNNVQQSKNKYDDDKRSLVRGGVGAQGMMTLIFPMDLTRYTQDFYDHLLDEFFEFGYYPDYSQIPPVYAGYGYTLKADLRLFNVFQLEPWWEKYKSFPLNINMEYYYYDSYNNYNREIDALYQFKPMYESWGISLLFVPGSARNYVFFTIGGGIGFYNGKLSIEADGEETINDQTSSIHSFEQYEGRETGYHGTIGLTYVPWKYLELETLLTGRYLNITEIEDQDGQVLINIYDDDEPVALQLSGIDFRFGIKFIFP
jgi:hypothetical protein